jgi:hypothetical protein
MNWWITASGGLAAVSAAGHALAGRTMFFQPIRARLADPMHAAVFTGMWHFITAHFVLSALFLLACGYLGRSDLAVALVVTQFATYAAINLLLSLRLGHALRLAQWLLFAGVAILAALGLAAS